MEQVLAPKFNFTPKNPKSGPIEGVDYGAGGYTPFAGADGADAFQQFAEVSPSLPYGHTAAIIRQKTTKAILILAGAKCYRMKTLPF